MHAWGRFSLCEACFIGETACVYVGGRRPGEPPPRECEKRVAGWVALVDCMSLPQPFPPLLGEHVQYAHLGGSVLARARLSFARVG